MVFFELRQYCTYYFLIWSWVVIRDRQNLWTTTCQIGALKNSLKSSVYIRNILTLGSLTSPILGNIGSLGGRAIQTSGFGGAVSSKVQEWRLHDLWPVHWKENTGARTCRDPSIWCAARALQSHCSAKCWRFGLYCGRETPNVTFMCM